MARLKIYRNEDIRSIYAFIPPGHKHARFIVETVDESILLQEASVAGLVRAYVMTAMHPLNRGIVLRVEKIRSPPRKREFAEHQAVEEALGSKALEIILGYLESLGVKYW